MATHYIDTSAANDGDGTASNQAASPGAAGAWNDFWGVLTDNVTYPVANGDVLIVRGHGGVVAPNASSPTTALRGNESAPVLVRLDDGTVWPADPGTLTVQIGTDSPRDWLIDGHYIFECANQQDFDFIHTLAIGNSGWMQIDTDAVAIFRKCGLRNTATAGTAANEVRVNSRAILAMEDCLYENHNAAAFSGVIDMPATTGGFVRIVGGKMDITGISNVAFGVNQFARLFVSGAEIDCDPGVLPISANDMTGVGSTVEFVNVIAPNMVFDQHIATSSKERIWATHVFGSGMNGKFDSFRLMPHGYQVWEQGKFYPTLDGLLPSGVGWSWKCSPSVVIGPGLPFQLMELSQFVQDGGAVKDVTLNLLLLSIAASPFLSPTDQDFYALVTYIDDTTGLPTTITTRGSGAALAAAPAEPWSALNYGANAYTAYQITIQTPTAVRDDTNVNVVLCCEVGAIDETRDFFFVDPEVRVSAP